MLDWKQFLLGRQPRHDLGETFVPDLVEEHEPALINTMAMLNAAAVGARLLKVVAERGGARLKPSALDKLLDVVHHALPEEVVHHCDDEARRIVEWLEHPEPIDHDALLPDAGLPELDIMRHSDIASRVSVAEYAIAEGMDVELEYYEPERRIWPRIRAEPVDIVFEDDEAAAAAFVEAPYFVFEDESGLLHIAVRNVRWLMPVAHRDTPEPAGARVLEFPGRREE